MVNTIVGGCGVKEKCEKQFRTGNNLNVVHQNIRSLWGKCGELEILLETKINNVEVLCFTEHWLNCHKMHAININHFTLANALSFELSVTELVQYAIIEICIYRTPDGKFDTF
jgi:hypothetical protein